MTVVVALDDDDGDDDEQCRWSRLRDPDEVRYTAPFHWSRQLLPGPLHPRMDRVSTNCLRVGSSTACILKNIIRCVTCCHHVHRL